MYCCSLLVLAASFGCNATNTAIPTYHDEAKAIIDARCATCHQAGDIGPFPLTSYDEVMAFKGAVHASIVNGTMPPWQPSDDCNTYVDNFDLTANEKDILLAWLDGDAPEGEPSNETVPSSPPTSEPFPVDISLQLPEPYTPTVGPDNHRCQLIPWPET